MRHAGHHVALLGRELIGGILVGRDGALQRLLRVSAGGKVLLLVQALSHPLEHIGLNLPHVLHVVFLLHSLGLAGDGVKGALLLRERWDALCRRHRLAGLHGLRRRGCEAAGC